MSNSNIDQLKGEIESILFASAKIISMDELLKLTGAKEKDIKKAISELSKDYEEKGGSLTLSEYNNSWKLSVKDKYSGVVEKVVTDTELPKGVLETLAVIAFKHPILQSEVIKIRSNKAYDHLKTLEDLGYIKRQKFSRTNKIQLTQKFFDYFDLPPDRVKEAFTSFNAVARAIDEKEEEIERIKAEKSKKGKEVKKSALEVYDTKEEFIQDSEDDFISDRDLNEGEQISKENADPKESEELPEIIKQPGIEQALDTTGEERYEEGESYEEPEEVQMQKIPGNEPAPADYSDERRIIRPAQVIATQQRVVSADHTNLQQDVDETTVKEVLSKLKKDAKSDESEEEESVGIQDYDLGDVKKIQQEVEEELQSSEGAFEQMSKEDREIKNVKKNIDDRADNLIKGVELGEHEEDKKDLTELSDDLEKIKDKLSR